MKRQESVQTESGRGFRKAACILCSAAGVTVFDYRVDSAAVDGNKTFHESLAMVKLKSKTGWRNGMVRGFWLDGAFLPLDTPAAGQVCDCLVPDCRIISSVRVPQHSHSVR